MQLAGSKNFSGKVVVNLTNPLDFSTGMPQRLAAGHDYSGGETMQRLPPDAKVVNAFNIIGDLHIFQPDFSGRPQIIFIRGSDECEKKLATEISDAFDESWRHRGDRNVAPAGAARDAVDNKLFQTNTGNHAFRLDKEIILAMAEFSYLMGC